VDAREDFFQRKFFSVTTVFRWVFVNIFKNLSAEGLCHLLHSVVRKVAMSVYVESFAFNASESLWHLDV